MNGNGAIGVGSRGVSRTRLEKWREITTEGGKVPYHSLIMPKIPWKKYADTLGVCVVMFLFAFSNAFYLQLLVCKRRCRTMQNIPLIPWASFPENFLVCEG